MKYIIISSKMENLGKTISNVSNMVLKQKNVNPRVKITHL